MSNITVLNSDFLKLFIENHIDEFGKALENLLKDDPSTGKAISSMAKGGPSNVTIDSAKPLIIGGMALADSKVDGQVLNTVIQTAAAEIQRIVDDQVVLFEDLEQAMRDTIELLAKQQGKNLENIAADEFMEIFEDVDSDFSDSGGGGGGGKGED